MFLSFNIFCQGFFVIVFFVSLKDDIFIMKLFYNTHGVRYYNFSIAEIIVESLNLMKMPKQKINHHDGER